jgi:hypothetical protein
MTLDQARRLHALGLSLIPLHADPPDQRKVAAVDWKRFQTTRCTDADLVKWFYNSDHNAGIVLGAVSNHIVCIESDTPESEAWCKTLTPTPMMTQSVRGFHRLYRTPVPWRSDSSALPAFVGPLQIELKRDGQYIVAPFSVHPTGHVYTMVEDWHVNLDDVPPLPWAAVSEGALLPGSHVAQPPLPDRIPNGARNSTLWTEACRLRRLGLDGEEINAVLQVINRKRCTPPGDPSKVRDIARRAAQYQPPAAFPTFPLQPLEVPRDDD